MIKLFIVPQSRSRGAVVIYYEPLDLSICLPRCRVTLTNIGCNAACWIYIGPHLLATSVTHEVDDCSIRAFFQGFLSSVSCLFPNPKPDCSDAPFQAPKPSAGTPRSSLRSPFQSGQTEHAKDLPLNPHGSGPDAVQRGRLHHRGPRWSKPHSSRFHTTASPQHQTQDPKPRRLLGPSCGSSSSCLSHHGFPISCCDEPKTVSRILRMGSPARPSFSSG